MHQSTTSRLPTSAKRAKQLETYYSLSYTTVSLVLLSPLGDYTLAALFNHKVQMRFDHRGVAWYVNLYCCSIFHRIIQSLVVQNSAFCRLPQSLDFCIFGCRALLLYARAISDFGFAINPNNIVD